MNRLLTSDVVTIERLGTTLTLRRPGDPMQHPNVETLLEMMRDLMRGAGYEIGLLTEDTGNEEGTDANK
jgi:hypothetical protein